MAETGKAVEDSEVVFVQSELLLGSLEAPLAVQVLVHKENYTSQVHLGLLIEAA